MSTPHTIILRGDGIRKEAIANAAITPGHLIAIASTGKALVHPTAGGPARKAFALENDSVGKGIDDAYAADQTVQYAIMQPGSEVYAWLADGEVVSIGDALASKGDGTLEKVHLFDFSPKVIADFVVAFALEAQGQSGSVANRIKVEVA